MQEAIKGNARETEEKKRIMDMWKEARNWYVGVYDV